MRDYRACQAALLKLAEKAPLKEDHDHGVKNIYKLQHDHEPQARKNFGTLWHLVDTDPTLLSAQRWGIHRETLFAYVRDKGYDVVRSSIDRVGQMGFVKNKAAYCCIVIKNKVK